MSNPYSSVTVFDAEETQNKTVQSDDVSFQEFSTSLTPDSHHPHHPNHPSQSPKGKIGSNLDNDPTRSSHSNAWFRIESYTIYFDVETKTVLERCWKTMYPKEDYVEVILAGQPDLYGPFWLPTTLIFILFFASSLSGALTAYLNSKTYDYDFTKLTLAVGLVYVYALGVPTCIWAAMRYWATIETRTIPEIINLYGYGLTIFIPVSLLSIPPIPILRGLMTFLAFGISCFFLLRNLYPILKSSENTSAQILLGLMVILHAVFCLILWFGYLGIGGEVLIDLPNSNGEVIGIVPSPP